jgi:hypothetical protein
VLGPDVDFHGDVCFLRMDFFSRGDVCSFSVLEQLTFPEDWICCSLHNSSSSFFLQISNETQSGFDCFIRLCYSLTAVITVVYLLSLWSC